MKHTIGIIGTGTLGGAMAAGLAERGHDLLIWNRTRAKAEAALQGRANIADSPEKIMASTNRVVVCVSDYQAVKEVLFPAGAWATQSPAEGLVLINTTTIAPAESIELGKKLAMLGIDYLEAPVSGGPVNAQLGRLACLTAGSQSLHDRCLPFLESFCSKIMYAGDTGKALTLKIVNNLMETVNMLGAAEAALILKRSNFDLAEAHPLLSGMRGHSIYMDVLFERLIKADGKVHSKAFMRLKDLDLAGDLIEACGMDAPQGLQAIRQFRNLVATFGPNVDQSECFRLLEGE